MTIFGIKFGKSEIDRGEIIEEDIEEAVITPIKPSWEVFAENNIPKYNKGNKFGVWVVVNPIVSTLNVACGYPTCHYYTYQCYNTITGELKNLHKEEIEQILEVLN